MQLANVILFLIVAVLKETPVKENLRTRSFEKLNKNYNQSLKNSRLS